MTVTKNARSIIIRV